MLTFSSDRLKSHGFWCKIRKNPHKERTMIYDAAIIGTGPAGLSAAINSVAIVISIVIIVALLVIML